MVVPQPHDGPINGDIEARGPGRMHSSSILRRTSHVARRQGLERTSRINAPQGAAVTSGRLAAGTRDRARRHSFPLLGSAAGRSAELLARLLQFVFLR